MPDIRATKSPVPMRPQLLTSKYYIAVKALLFFTEKNKAEPLTPDRPGGSRRRRTRRGEPQASRPESPLAVNSPPSPLEYESIRRDPELEEIRQTFTEDHQFKYGTPNPSLPPTKVACGGCGALLHARQARFPSYFQRCLRIRIRIDPHKTMQIRKTSIIKSKLFCLLLYRNGLCVQCASIATVSQFTASHTLPSLPRQMILCGMIFSWQSKDYIFVLLLISELDEIAAGN
jgi:hypothetical protein